MYRRNIVEFVFFCFSLYPSGVLDTCTYSLSISQDQQFQCQYYPPHLYNSKCVDYNSRDSECSCGLFHLKGVVRWLWFGTFRKKKMIFKEKLNRHHLWKPVVLIDVYTHPITIRWRRADQTAKGLGAYCCDSSSDEYNAKSKSKQQQLMMNGCWWNRRLLLMTDEFDEERRFVSLFVCIVYIPNCPRCCRSTLVVGHVLMGWLTPNTHDNVYYSVFIQSSAYLKNKNTKIWTRTDAMINSNLFWKRK